MHKHPISLLIFLPILTLLTNACDKAPSFAELCEANPEICNEFKEDTWCKTERINVGFANVLHKTQPVDKHKFTQLIAYEEYAQCMDHASKIEHIKFKEKQSMRINNTAQAKRKIIEISKQTENSAHPDLLYYHWSRYLNNKSLETFLALENTNELETPQLQFNLATYYAKKDQRKTLNLLYHALELSTEDQTLHREIFTSIATIFADRKKYKQVYIWSKILAIHSPEDTSIKNVNLNQYAKTFNLNEEFLDTVAVKTLESILEGRFKSP